MTLSFEDVDLLRGVAAPEITDEQIALWSKEFLSRWSHDDMALRWVRKIQSGVGPTVHSVEDVLGERYCLAANVAILDDDRWMVDPRPHGLQIAMQMMTASPYLWTTEIASEVDHLELPSHVVSRKILPEPFMWWTTPDEFSVADLDMHLQAQLVVDHGEGFTIWGLLVDGEGKLNVAGGSVRYGTRYPEDFSEASREAMGAVLGRLAFLNSPYVPRRKERASRGARRIAQRLDQELDDVTFVDLRRIKTVKGQNEEGEALTYRHRWLVRGHYRAQWYSSEDAHHVIYIAPYIKGPEDAPMLSHINRVRR